MNKVLVPRCIIVFRNFTYGNFYEGTQHYRTRGIICILLSWCGFWVFTLLMETTWNDYLGFYFWLPSLRHRFSWSSTIKARALRRDHTYTKIHAPLSIFAQFPKQILRVFSGQSIRKLQKNEDANRATNCNFVSSVVSVCSVCSVLLSLHFIFIICSNFNQSNTTVVIISGIY